MILLELSFNVCGDTIDENGVGVGIGLVFEDIIMLEGMVQ